MIFEDYLTKILNNPIETVKIIVEVLVLLILLQFHHRGSSDVIPLKEETVDKLIKEFEPDDLIPQTPPEILLDFDYHLDYLDLSSYDAFGLRNKFKDELRETVRNYGIGTCGPRTFYGTLDIHLELEETIASVLGTEKAIIYSNYYSCITSVISCFCTAGDRVFYQKTANEGILRGLYVSKAKTFEFTTMNSLEGILTMFVRPNVRNYVVVEGLSKNTGMILALPKLLALKKQFNFRIILDEAYSFPLIHTKGISGYYSVNIKEIDMIVGSFSTVFPSNGGFFAGPKLVCEYQQLSSSSYVFSASLPAVFTKFNILALLQKYNPRNLSTIFCDEFTSKYFKIISSRESPLIIITVNENDYPVDEKNLLRGVYLVKHHFQSKKIYLGINKNPIPSLRIILKMNLKETEVAELAKTISEECDRIFLSNITN